ncbi:histidine phosphatase family protein [Candidatus Peregrinibacteria bacterium]|nr:histidine phosphatase family protein [Candidatus Peregrinibacteria bacterium]
MPIVDLVRHGRIAENLDPKLLQCRANNVELTEQGFTQAQLLGEYWKGRGVVPDYIWSSPAIRCIQTANKVCKVLGIPSNRIQIDDGLHEIDQGDWEGVVREEVQTPEKMFEINADVWNFAPPNGESLKMVGARMEKTINRLTAPFDIEDNTRIAVFTHSFAKKCYLKDKLGLNVDELLAWYIHETGVSRLRKTMATIEVDFLNNIGHLAR